MWQIVSNLGGAVFFFALAYPFRKRNKAPKFVTLCHLLAGCGLAFSVIGSTIDTVTSFIPQILLGVLVTGASLIFGIGLVIDLKDGRPDKQAQMVALFLPVLLILVPGAFGQQTKTMVQQVGRATQAVSSQTR